MPSIYPTLKHSDRKFIRTEKARIRRQFSDGIKQKELIMELYKRLLPQVKAEAAKEAKPVKKEEPKKVSAAVKTSVNKEVKRDKKVKAK